jgi:hypothetical protein
MSFNDKTMTSSLIYKIEEKINFFIDYPIISLFIIGIISLSIRLLFFEPDLPIRQDANAYFWYAIDMSILNYFPNSYHANDGWPMFLSSIFSMFNFNNYLDYTILQRLTTIIISIITIIPVYYLCKKFFQPSYSIVGAALFAFEPHLIQNSLLGLTEPLYIILVITSLSLFLNKNKKLTYFSFGLIALSTLVRAEGIIIFGILCILFFIFNKRDKKTISKFFLAIFIFVIIFGSMTMMKADANEDGLESTAALNIGRWAENTITNQNNEVSDKIGNGAETLAKRLVQSMIPYFALFVPFGIIIAFKDQNKNKFLILILLIIYLIALMRMFSIVSDGRLLLVLYPLFGILSVYTIQHFTQKFEFKKIVLVLIISGCIILSIYFLYSNNNSDYQQEAYIFANYMIDNVSVSNNFYPESGFVYGAWASSELKFPIISSEVKYSGPELLDYVKDSNFAYLTNSANSVEEYIKLARNQNLSHLVVDNNEKRTLYFKDIFYNEEKYPYLIKEFDSIEKEYTHYNVKVFKIDYEKFDILFKEN